MSRERIALKPTQDTNHTEVTVMLPLRRPLAAWELMDLCELLKARSQLPVRVALSAEAPSEWLDEWCSALADASALNRRRGTDRGAVHGEQSQTADGEEGTTRATRIRGTPRRSAAALKTIQETD